MKNDLRKFRFWFISKYIQSINQSLSEIERKYIDFSIRKEANRRYKIMKLNNSIFTEILNDYLTLDSYLTFEQKTRIKLLSAYI